MRTFLFLLSMWTFLLIFSMGLSDISVLRAQLLRNSDTLSPQSIFSDYPTIEELKNWPAYMIQEREKELVERFGYKGWNLILAHALSKEIGDFKVPDFTIIEINEIWKIVYEENVDSIDEIIEANNTKMKFIRSVIEVHRQFKSRIERRKILDQIYEGQLKFMKNLFLTESVEVGVAIDTLEGFEEMLFKKYGYLIDFSNITEKSTYRFVAFLIDMKLDDLINKLDINLPKEIVSAHYSYFDGRAIFIRTSATDEDTKENAQAGKYHSRSVPQGVDEGVLLRLLKSTIHRNLMNMTNHKANMAFIFQDKLQGDDLEGGVAFSNLNEEVVLELGFGWVGDSDVKRNPLERATVGNETMIVKMKDKRIRDLRYNKVKSGHSKLLHQIGINGKKYNVTVSQDVLMRVHDIAKKIEGKLGYPVDIEFGVKNDEIYIVQIRPITTNNIYDIKIPEFVNPDDIVVECPVAVNQCVASQVKVIYVDGILKYGMAKFLVYFQNRFGLDNKFIVCANGSMGADSIVPFLYGDQLFWVGEHVSKINHGSINVREKGKNVIMGFFRNMSELRDALGALEEIEPPEYVKKVNSIWVSREEFDLYSDGSRAVIVKTGAKTKFFNSDADTQKTNTSIVLGQAA